MRASAAAVVAGSMIVLAGPPPAGACPRHKARHCRVDLTLAPAASRRIVAGEKIAAPRAAAPAAATLPPYTGPTVGAVPTLPQAPEIGYRWSIN